VEDFEMLLGSLPNYQFKGAYQYPDELAQIYGSVDFNWTFDESDPGGNSAWLLPNRIYEGGCFGVPALGGCATETGRWIQQHGQGWTFQEPLEENLIGFFEAVEVSEWEKVRQACLAHPRGEFTGEVDYLRLSERLTALEKRL
jgi:succinoglycan biosynthesis protein ExoL